MTHISVVIPSFNRRQSVCDLVSTLMVQHDPSITTEIIVVLDGSTDGSAEALSQVTPPVGMRFLVHTQPNCGLANARNTGWQLATGEIVLFLDDDMLPAEQFVEAYVHAHQATEADVVLGRIDGCTVGAVSDVVTERERHFYADRHRRLSTHGTALNILDVSGNSISVRQSRLRAVGGFDETFRDYGAEDTDLALRLLKVGATFSYAPNAAAAHYYAGTPRQWRRRAWYTGRAQINLAIKHPELKPSYEFGRLAALRWRRRFAAQLAIQFPKLGMIGSTITFSIASLIRPMAESKVAEKLMTFSWILAFWSGVRSALGSARAVRAYCRLTDDVSSLSRPPRSDG